MCFVEFVFVETVYFITVYSKSEKENLTKEERNAIKMYVEMLKKNLGGESDE